MKVHCEEFIDDEDFDHLVDLKETILDFIDDLKNNIFNIPECEGDFILMRLLIKGYNERNIMDIVIDRVLPEAPYIKKREIDHFIKASVIFDKLPEDKVAFYKDKFKNGYVSPEDMDVLWSFIDTIVALAEDYKKEK